MIILQYIFFTLYLTVLLRLYHLYIQYIKVSFFPFNQLLITVHYLDRPPQHTVIAHGLLLLINVVD